MSAPNTISIDKLVRLIGTPKCPLLVDVRPQDDFEADPHLIPSAIHCAFDKLEDRVESVRRAVCHCDLPKWLELKPRRGGFAPASGRSSGSAGRRVRSMEAGEASVSSLRQASPR